MSKIKNFFSKDRLISWVKNPIFWLAVTTTIASFVFAAKAPLFGGIAIGAGAAVLVSKVIKK